MAAMLRFNRVRKKRKPETRGNPNMRPGVSGNPGGTRVAECDKKPKPKRRSKRGNPAWVEGMPRPSGGRPKGARNKYRITDLVNAIHKIEDERAGIRAIDVDDSDLLEHFVRRAFVSDQTLNNLFKKILPDLKAMEVSTDPEKPFQLIINLDAPTAPFEADEENAEEE